MKSFYIALGVISLVIIVIVIVIFLMMIKITRVMISSNFDQRYDDRHTLKYFTVDDFENLKNEPIEFTSNNGQKLRGFLYSSTLFTEYKALMVVSHGLGAGHLQYTTEINYFAQKGYLVFAFDDTGCNLSEGDKINGVTQGLIDLDYALKYIDSNDRLKDYKKVLFGHSMGAFSVLNVTSLNKTKISGVVSLAPFNDEASMLFEQFRAITKLKYKTVYRLLKKNSVKRFGDISKINTIDSLKDSDIPTFIIAGDQDPMVDYYSNFCIFKELYENKENFKFLSVEGRYHRPNLSLKAAQYDQDTNVELQQLHGEYKGNTPQERIDEFYKKLDYDLLVEMDDDVMNKISSFLDNCLEDKGEKNEM